MDNDTNVSSTAALVDESAGVNNNGDNVDSKLTENSKDDNNNENNEEGSKENGDSSKTAESSYDNSNGNNEKGSKYVLKESDINENDDSKKEGDGVDSNNNNGNNDETNGEDNENTEEEQKVDGYVNTRLDHILTTYNNNYEESKPETKCAISFEYYPSRTMESLKNLYEKIERMKVQKPLYNSVTWGAGGSTAKVSLDIAKVLKGKFGLIPNLHLTCTNMEKHIIKETLDDCILLKINNVMALRGDEVKDPTDDEANEFKSAIDLIKYMRENYNDWEFCIQTSGYPEGHPGKITKVVNPKMLTEDEKKRIIHRPDADYVCHEEEYQQEIDYLREKVEAGANVIITQFFFDVSVYINFVEKCREAGIDVPIIPGIMIILAYGSFKRIQDFSRCRVPDEVAEKMERLKKDPPGVHEYGIELATNMCKELLEYGVPALHFYTLNMEKSVNEVLKNIGRYVAADDGKKKRSSSSGNANVSETKVLDGDKNETSGGKDGK
jgi:methylenetetrahydrofolate reductase (NADPH)